MQSPRWLQLPRPASIMVILRRCSMRRAIGVMNSSSRTTDKISDDPCNLIRSLSRVLGRLLLEAQRHEAQLAVGARNQEQHRFAAIFLELVDLCLEIVGALHGLLRDLHNHVSRR